MSNLTRLYVYNITRSPIPNLKANMRQSAKFTSYICLFCLDLFGHVILLTCPFRPFILFKFKTEPDDESVLQTAMQELNESLCKGWEKFSIEKVYQTPLFSFTNSRKDVLWKLYYSNLNTRKKLVKHLDREGFTTESGENLGPVTVYHQNTLKINCVESKCHEEDEEFRNAVKDEQLFMQMTEKRGHMWIDVILPQKHPKPYAVSRNISAIYENVDPKDIHLLPDDLTEAPLSVVYMRLHALSSTATATNAFQADFKIPGDAVNMICLLHQQFGPNSKRKKPIITILQDAKEDILFEKFKSYMDQTNPQILIQSSCQQNDLEYLTQRAKERDIGLSMLRDVNSTAIYNPTTFKLSDVTHVGRERMDIVPILQKFQVSPPLKGFALVDVYDHPKLIDPKKRAVELDTLPLHPRASLVEIEERLRQEVMIMYYLVVDNSFIQSQCLLASSCDTSVTTICESGVQKQTTACIMRACIKRNIYANHEFIDSTEEKNKPLIIKRKRADSSFPHPPPTRNPSVEEILGAKVKFKKRKFSMKRFFEQEGIQAQQPATKKTKKGYAGGFVVTPEAGFYRDLRLAAAILDFSSLYPSVIVGYLICYMTVLYKKDEHLLDDPRATLRFVSINDDECSVFVIAYDGVQVETIVPEVTSEIMERRAALKKLMKTFPEGSFNYDTLNNRQLTAKVQANGLYGFIGSTTSGMNVMPVAAAVCVIAQFMNRSVIYEAHKTGICRIIYGDTDSTFTQWNICDVIPADQEATRDEILNAIVTKAFAFAKACSARIPKPNGLVFEALKTPIILGGEDGLTKKLHLSLAYGPPYGNWEKEAEVCAKGPAFRKRDRCQFVQETGWKILGMYLHQVPHSELLRVFGEIIDNFGLAEPKNLKDLEPFLITCRLGENYATNEILAVHLKQNILEESGCMTKVGMRMQYVVARFSDGRKRFKHAMTSKTFLKNNHKLDTTYYLKTQLLAPLGQFIKFHDPQLWMQITRIVGRRAQDLEISSEKNKVCFTRFM